MPTENPWLDRRVLAYAHQGGAWSWPSSTLFAMRNAVAAGAPALELDAHGTKDGYVVVCHDPTVDRTTNGTGAIADLTLSEVQSLDSAYWFIPGADVTPGRPESDYPYRGRSDTDTEFRIASLAEVLEAFPDVILNLDIKQSAPVVAPYEKAVADLLAEFGRSDDVIVTSFDDDVTETFSSFAPDVPTSAGTVGTAAFWRAVSHDQEPPPTSAVAFQVPERYGDIVLVDGRFVQAAHRHGVAVHVWTVNDTESMQRLVDLDVDGIISDLPAELMGVLRDRSVAWEGPGGPA
ncbi:MAG: glycerophosphodiester phosphodiesterase [Acidimicrobiales bacterium]